MGSSSSVFKCGWEMLWEQPGAYFVVAILPHIATFGLVILIGRLVVRVVRAHAPVVDAVTLWASMDWA